jgi:hypothetical protein
MTLAVARIQGDRIAIAADTRLSKPGAVFPAHEGAVKTCIINCTICVAFSNSPELAQRDFLTFAQKFRTAAPSNEAVEYFEKSSTDTGNDYILAFSNPPRLVKIENGKRVSSVAKTIWIGDRDAYEAFRRYELDRRARVERGRAINAVLFADEMDGSPASDLYSAMRHVIADRTIQHAGDFVSVVSNRPEGFRYSVYSDMLYDWPGGESEDYLMSLNDKLQLGASGENSEFCIAQLSPGYIGANCLAFYFAGARCLFVFFGPNNSPAHQCRVIRDVAPDMVQPALFKLLGFDWKWLALVTSAPPSKGGRRDSNDEPASSGIGMSFVCCLNTMPKAQPG